MTFKSIILASLCVGLLAGCGDTINEARKASEEAAKVAATSFNGVRLDEVLAMQDEKAKARYDARNPAATLEFFGIAPGMTVVEALPGGGWYSKILLPYLGDEGHLVGVDYSLAMWPEFGGFATEEFIEGKKNWPSEWAAKAEDWRGGNNAKISAFAFGTRDASLDGTVDAVLFIRAMHNLARFDAKGGYWGQALEDAHALLKPGGIVGIVQHQGPETNEDEWADGNNGYLKKSAVIARMEAAGFTLAGESAINENAKDNPSNTDIVWRLPPSLGTSRDNPELAAKMKEIGESNRMTLLFKKN